MFTMGILSFDLNLIFDAVSRSVNGEPTVYVHMHVPMGLSDKRIHLVKSIHDGYTHIYIYIYIYI